MESSMVAGTKKFKERDRDLLTITSLREIRSMTRKVKPPSILLPAGFHIAAGAYGLALTSLIAPNFFPLYAISILSMIAGVQLLRSRRWGAVLALLLCPLMAVVSISTLHYSLYSSASELKAELIALHLSLALYAAFSILSPLIILSEWKEFK